MGAGKSRGCMLGAAVGDALGAPVEFLTLDKIKEKYGENGIVEYVARKGSKPGAYTDDTQMTLATAVGCIRHRKICKDGKKCDFKTVVYQEYLEWYEMQKNPDNRRSPGNTCLGALGSGKMGTADKRINDSKGCGGVMRTSPIGIAYLPEEAFQYGLEAAAITHGHPSGFLPAAFLADLIARLFVGVSLEDAIDKSSDLLKKHFEHEETLDIIKLALEFAAKGKPAEKAIPLIGEGWLGHEALAIALYCSLSFPADWGKAVFSAVNITGDSDSTGSITGAIIGTLHGERGIPNNLVNNIENRGLIIKIAEDLFAVRK
ncbi:MAG: ADP-ribosylglycohydrolase family protein [Bacillota bacterium]